MGKIDLTGRKFSRLTVIEKQGIDDKIKAVLWKCKCECGKERVVSTGSLNNGSIKACERLCEFRTNMIGKIFGKLTVVNFIRQGGGTKYECVCVCGNKRNVLACNLKSGLINSCGCDDKRYGLRKDWTGTVVNLLTVIKFVERRKNGRSVWKCRCECGNTCNISNIALSNGQLSCGCRKAWKTDQEPKRLYKDWPAYFRWLRKDPSRRIRNNVSTIVRMALHGNKGGKSVFSFLPYTIEELKTHLENQWEAWMSWDNYGGRANDPRQTWHIDHIVPQSAFPYTSMDDYLFKECWALTNLRPLEKKTNMSKGSKQNELPDIKTL